MNTYMRFFDKIFTFFKSIGESFYDSVIYDNRYEFILEGLFHTIIIAFFAVIIGIILGIIIALIRHNYDTNGKMRIGNKICAIYVNIIRGTPVLLQLMIIYYVIFKSVNINIVIVGILAFGLNSAAYVSEIIRSGLISVDKGQMEAGLALGLSYGKVMRYIILPQAIRNILPALGNEFITLLKETSAGAYIGILELTKASDIIASRTYDYFFPLIITAFIYLIMTLGLSKLVNVMERRLSNARS
ncbi:MAG: amino acid ABC transporter permease [Bacilli bacterium]